MPGAFLIRTSLTPALLGICILKLYMRIRTVLTVIVSANLFFFSSCDSEKKKEPAGRARQQGPLTVDAFVVKKSAVSEDVEVPGSLLPFEETAIRAEVGGRIVKLNVQEGFVVQKGTLLVKLFDEDLRAQLNKLKVQLQINEKTEERNRELLKINA